MNAIARFEGLLILFVRMFEVEIVAAHGMGDPGGNANYRRSIDVVAQRWGALQCDERILRKADCFRTG